MKLLKDGYPGGVYVSGCTELQIAIDFTHEPWRTLAGKMLHLLNEELEEMDFGIAGIEEILDIITQTDGGLQ